MRASGPFVLKIFVKGERAGDADALADTVRSRAAGMRLTDVRVDQDDTGPVIRIAGPEADLRRFWAAANDLKGLGLMVLQAA